MGECRAPDDLPRVDVDIARCAPAPRLGTGGRGETIDTGQLVAMTWPRTPEDVTFKLACPPKESAVGTHPDVSPTRRRTRGFGNQWAHVRDLDLPDTRRLPPGGCPVTRLMERRWEKAPFRASTDCSSRVCSHRHPMIRGDRARAHVTARAWEQPCIERSRNSRQGRRHCVEACWPVDASGSIGAAATG